MSKRDCMNNDPARGWTKTPNEILEAMPDMTEAELKLTAVLMRQTYGYHRNEVKMTYDDMMTKANINSRTTISDAIDRIERRGFFVRGRRSMWLINSPVNGLNQLDESPSTGLNEVDDSPVDGLNEPEKSPLTGLDESPSTGLFQSYKETPNGEKRKDRPRVLTQLDPERPFDARLLAIAEVCERDSTIHREDLDQPTAQLSGFEAAYILARYGRNPPPDYQGWQWYRDDFRGQKGQSPEPRQVVATINKSRPVVASNGSNEWTAVLDELEWNDG